MVTHATPSEITLGDSSQTDSLTDDGTDEPFFPNKSTCEEMDELKWTPNSQLSFVPLRRTCRPLNLRCIDPLDRTGIAKKKKTFGVMNSIQRLCVLSRNRKKRNEKFSSLKTNKKKTQLGRYRDLLPGRAPAHLTAGQPRPDR